MSFARGLVRRASTLALRVSGGCGLLALLLASTTGLAQSATMTDQDLIPRPRLALPRGEAWFDLANGVFIDSNRPEEDVYAMQVLRELCDRSRPIRKERLSLGRRIFLRAGQPTEALKGAVAEQSYSIDVTPQRIVITGPTAAARLYAVGTLRQLALVHGCIPSGTISDGPALAVRGMSLDVSRGRMPRRADFICLLDLCASFKLNYLLLYIEDTYEYSHIPKTALRDYGLTPQSIRELAQQASLRSIALVPIVQTLGHQARLLSHPSMWSHAEAPGWTGPWSRALLAISAVIEQGLAVLNLRGPSRVVSSQFAVTERGTQGLLDSMVDDVLAASGATQLHIGCDEPSELGQGASRARAEDYGIERVYVDHVRRLVNHARVKWNARTWIYNDFVFEHPAVLDSLPRDVVLVDWRKYDPAADYADLEALNPQERSRIVTSPGLWNWFAIVPSYRRAVASIVRSTQVAKRTGCLGSVLASWGDGGSEDLLGNDISGIAYFADCSWAPDERSRQDFARTYSRIRFGGSVAGAEAAIAALLDLDIPDVVYSQRLVYRPILLRRRTARWLSRLDEVDSISATVSSRLAQMKPRDTYAAEEIQALRASLGRLDVAIRRERALDRLAAMLENSARSSSDVSAAATLSGLVEAEVRAQTDYEQAWLDHNEVSELEAVQRRFRRQLRDLDSLRLCAERGTLQAYEGRQRRVLDHSVSAKSVTAD